MTRPDGRLVLKMSVSLDGFVGRPDGGIDWLMSRMDDTAGAWVAERLQRASVHVMGSNTFRDMAAWWPRSTEIFAPAMNAIPKVVFSRSGVMHTTNAQRDARAIRGEPNGASAVESWDKAEVARGDLSEEIAALKRRYQTVLAHGGARFARSLVASGAIDEYWLVIHPVALGEGLALFSGLNSPLGLQLVEQRRFATGAMALVLRPEGR